MRSDCARVVVFVVARPRRSHFLPRGIPSRQLSKLPSASHLQMHPCLPEAGSRNTGAHFSLADVRNPAERLRVHGFRSVRNLGARRLRPITAVYGAAA